MFIAKNMWLCVYAQNSWYQNMMKIPSTHLDLETNNFARNSVLPGIWRVMMTLMTFFCMSNWYKSCKHLKKDSHPQMAEIIETTGHIAFSLGTFIKEQLEVGFLEQPVVTFNSCCSGLLPREFCFQYLCSAAGNGLPQGMRVSPVLQNQCARGSSVAHGNKSFFGGKVLCKWQGRK